MSASRSTTDAALRESDQRARALAQRVFDRPLILEAGAGTGKTTALVARVLAWCLGVGWDRALASLEPDDDARLDRVASMVLSGVVAITFTEKAAAEMSQRIGEALRDVERGERPAWLIEEALPDDTDERRIRAGALTGALDRLVVATIHAYCRRILVDNALDAGLHPSLEVDADGQVQAEIVREVLERVIETAYTESGDPAFLGLAARGIGPRELERELLALLDTGTPASAFDADPVSPDRVVELCERFAGALEGLVRSVSPLAGRGGIGGASAARIDETLEWLRTQTPADRAGLDALARWLRENWPKNEHKRIGDWGRGRFIKSEIGALGTAVCDDPATRESAASVNRILTHLIEIDVDLLDLARTALAQLLARIELVLRQRGVATFSALLRETRALLRGNERVAGRIRAGIDQLLVDEFQDTDLRQCDIIRSLALGGIESTRPGLFLVGDPKQSIYGWRNADLAAYDAFIDDVLAAGGTRERLSVNHRSVPAILEEVERIIAPAMNEQPGLQPAFQPLIPSAAKLSSKPEASEGRIAGSVPVEHWVSAEWDEDAAEPRKTRSSEATRIEADALARDLRELHDRDKVEWASIGVLFRGRSDWEIYLSALRNADVPFVVEGDRSYYRRREIIEAASLVRSVLDPNDQLALLTLLRSSMVGVPDAALIPLWSRDLPARISELETPCPNVLSELANWIRDAILAVPRDVPGIDRIRGWEENLIGVVTDIAVLRESFECDASDVFVEKLRTRSLFEAAEATRFLGAWRCANLDRFFRELTEALAEGGDTHALLRRLRNGVAAEEDGEEGRPVEIVDDAVAVMTIHGAKGLDFEHVYLMQLHKGVGAVSGADCGASEVDGRFEYRLCGASSPGWDRVNLARDRVSEAERVRTLYVAMTRAKQRLVLAGVWPSLQLRSGVGQPVEMLEPRFEGDLHARMSEVAAAGCVGFADRFGARFSFPVLAPEAPVQPSRSTLRGAGLPAESDVARASARLCELRAEAAKRMERPIGRAASMEAHTAANIEVGIETRSGSKSFAREVGTAIHRVLEEIDCSTTMSAAALESHRASLALHLESIVEPRNMEAAVTAGTDLLNRIAGGKLLERLVELSDCVLARELPVLCGPRSDQELADGDDGDLGPIGYFAGTIDLVYRDPETDEIVVADYKTDSIEAESELKIRAAMYRHQGNVYQCALRDAMGLAEPPRFELWFLHADRII
ncbi:MAG: UvrD-helicase domain-containing protein [Myxococcota bacterium]